jgi:hypothetical protein
MLDANDPKYDFNRGGSRGKRVGQAVTDILAGPCESQTVGETLDAFGPKFIQEMEQCIEENTHKYKSPFYIFVLTKKEMFADNIVRNYFIARQTPPYAFDMLEQYANYGKTLYIVDAKKGRLEILWSIPGFQDCLSVAKSPLTYDPQLVRWIEDCFQRKLDRDSYSFDELPRV